MVVIVNDIIPFTTYGEFLEFVLLNIESDNAMQNGKITLRENEYNMYYNRSGPMVYINAHPGWMHFFPDINKVAIYTISEYTQHMKFYSQTEFIAQLYDMNDSCFNYKYWDPTEYFQD